MTPRKQTAKNGPAIATKGVGCRGQRGPGRPRGIPNKLTRDVREGFRVLIESNVPHFATWLNAVAKQNPARALELVARLSEFFIPKLTRTELRVPLTTHDGEPLTVHDPVEAAQIYERLMKGELALDAVRFEPLPGPTAPSPSAEEGQ